jgi:catechol 2,3-dioxygenase-like lactoylglutathione lyase family enzyme
MITAIDHIALAVRDCDAVASGYETIFGRRCEWRGEMEGARHAFMQLDNMALDIIAPYGKGRFAERVRSRLESHGEGVWGLGFCVDDLDAACRTIERRGVHVAERTELVTRNTEGDQRGWTFANLGHDSTAGIPTFLVQKATTPWPLSPAIGTAPVSALDHIVISTQNAERALAHYGARLGLDLRLDRSNEQWGARQLFFRCGTAIVEIGASLKAAVSNNPDRFGGLAWRVADPETARERIAAAGIDVSEVRTGRKPGTSVFTVRSGTGNVPTLMLSGND